MTCITRQHTPAGRAVARHAQFAPVRSNLLQRQCTYGNAPGVIGEGQEGRKNSESGMLQRKSTHSFSISHPSGVPPIVHEVLNSPGQSLDEATRVSMESHLGHDFSQVRVHTDTRAAKSARAVNALAYTVGQDVVFGTGRYASGTPSGRQLVVHELVHTVQQGVLARPVGAIEVSDPSDEHERQAASITAQVASLDPHQAGEMNRVLGASASSLNGGRGEMRIALSGAVRLARTDDGAPPAPLSLQSDYGVLDKDRRTPMAIETGDQGADEILWTVEAMLDRADRIRSYLRNRFGADRDLQVTSVVKPGEHTTYRKMDVVPAGSTTWEELAEAAVAAGFWVHAEGVTLAGKLWPLSPNATGPHLDLYLIGRNVGDFPLPVEPQTEVPT